MRKQCLFIYWMLCKTVQFYSSKGVAQFQPFSHNEPTVQLNIAQTIQI